MQIRDRVRELRRVRAGELRPNPRNWRTHPDAQRDALRGILAEVGYADALLARELSDGSLELIDGHLRAETTPEALVPVLVVELSDAEAVRLLALHDPLAAMAGADDDALAELLQEVHVESAAVQAMLDRMLASAGEADACSGEPSLPPTADAPHDEEPAVPEAWQVLVECRDEPEQRELFERLSAEGFACRLLTL